MEDHGYAAVNSEKSIFMKHESGDWIMHGSISRSGALAQRRGFGTCGWKGVGTPNSRPNSARGILRRNGTGHPEWVRCHGPRAGAASHHACGREELLRCWADSETVAKDQAYTTPLCKTERRNRGLDSVARDNPA
jgi:hypothetical protein